PSSRRRGTGGLDRGRTSQDEGEAESPASPCGAPGPVVASNLHSRSAAGRTVKPGKAPPHAAVQRGRRGPAPPAPGDGESQVALRASHFGERTMLLFFLRWWLRQGRFGRRRRQPAGGRGWGPRLEVLEDRTVPSTLSVTTNGDDVNQQGTLR